MEWVRGEIIGRGSFSTINIATPRNHYSEKNSPLMAVKSASKTESAMLYKEKDILSCLRDSPRILQCLGDDTTFEDGREVYNVFLELASRGNLAELMKSYGGNPNLNGTPLYMSPESVSCNEQETPSDIWALGCVVLEMITGKPAWRCGVDADVSSLLFRIGFSDGMPEIPDEVSEQGKDFLKKCLLVHLLISSLLHVEL